MNKTARDELQKILDAATKGQWEWSEPEEFNNRDGDSALSLLTRAPLFGILSCDGPANGPSPEDAAAIVALHNAAPDLLADSAALDDARERLAIAMRLIDWAREQMGDRILRGSIIYDLLTKWDAKGA